MKQINLIEIENFEMPELDIFARMTDSQLLHFCEPDLGLFIAESCNVILRAMRKGYRPLSLIIEKRRLDELADVTIEDRSDAAPSEIPNSGGIEQILSYLPDVPIYTAEVKALNQLIGFKLTGGILCAMKRQPLPDIAEIVQGARRIVVLEKVQNPINVGSVFRSAAALGIDAVLLTAGCADPLYRRADRVSMGTVFQVPWTYISLEDMPREQVRPSAEDPGRYVHRLQELGFKTAALALTDDSVSIDDPELMAEERLAIIMGTEGEGLLDETIADCDYTVKIPMTNGVDSLNVAAASAVAFWQLTR